MNVQKELRSAGIAARMLGIPIVQRVGLPGDIRDKFDQRIAQRCLVDEILVTSPWIEAELPRRFDFIPASKVHCILNGKPVLAAPKSTKWHSPRFVIASRLDPGKGHRSLIDAFCRLYRNGYRDFSCDIFGDGVLRDELSAQIRAAGLENRLRLRGFCRDLRSRLPGYDFAVLASRVEGVANTALEYFSAALPSILSDGAVAGMGMPGLFDRRHGFSFPFDDAPTLAGCLQTCLDMPERRYLELSRAVHDLASSQFKLESRVGELREFFAGVTETAQRGARAPASGMIRH
jgi:glycosyltransferase involved in cell wall biosynthesis